LPRSVTTSRNVAVSRFKESTSGGDYPPADACPVTEPGRIVIIPYELGGLLWLPFGI
jgi:hypothetical protein